MTKGILFFITFLFILPNLVFSAVTDYLILQDIAPYKLFTAVFPEDFKGKPLPKYSQTNTGGILGAAGHFSENDVSYEAAYTEPSSKWPFVKVEVTKHSGSDSDKWLLHEVERGFRKSKEMHSRYSAPNPIREINGNKIWATWGYYRWVSKNVVVSIQFTDLTGTKPEPLEVVQAYLKKFPSTIPTTLVLDKPHDEKWIKDEMERRLWLCDKWYMQFQLKKVEQAEMLKQLVENMNVFLDYREKYFKTFIFFKEKAFEEKNLLWNYLSQNNGTEIKNKLTEYKEWWKKHKDKGISP